MHLWAVSALALFTSSAVAAESTRCFPDGFLFGSATAAYQVEGAWNEGGRTPSIWDDFCHANSDVACANVADDFYHRYKSDIQLMVETGLKSFRFSISWSRAMNWDPETKQMKANPQGIAFYHDLIGELNKNGITPILTLYHWDLPSELQNELDPPGWLNAEIIDHFVQFSELMYQEFGSKVQYWTTFNEPLSFISSGYATGMGPPQLGGSETNAYTATHNMLLAHGRAVQRFRALQQQENESKVVNAAARISIVLNFDNGYPLNASDPADVAAAARLSAFDVGWFLNPIVNGDYPAVIRERAGANLPEFTPEEVEIVKGSYDLFMLNHYSSRLVTDCDSFRSTVDCARLSPGWERDLGIDDTRTPDGARRAGDKNDKCQGFNGYSQGYMDTIKWMHAFDPKAEILLTENGWCGNEEIDNQDQLWYYQTHLEQVYKAITEENIPIIGYTAWSFLDNYEWGSFKPRFGLYYVNWTAETGAHDEVTPKNSDLSRVPRTAAKWYAQLAKTNCLNDNDDGALGIPAAAKVTTGTSTASTWSSDWVILALAVVVIGVIVVVAHRYMQSRGTAQEKTPLVAERK